MKEYVKLSEVCNIIMGQSPESNSYNELGNGLPFFQGNADFGELYPVTKMWCTEPKKIVEKNTLLISVRAPIGALNFSTERCCIGRGLAGITAKAPTDLKYIYYGLMNKKEELNRLGTGSTFKAINKKVLKNTLIVKEKAERQHNIVKVLDKNILIIAHLQKQLYLLDELVKSRFVEMFGSVKTNSMNWPIVEIGNIIEKLEAGWSGSGQQRDKKSGEIAVLKVSSVTQGYFIPEECKVLDNQKNIKKYIFPQKGDLLFSRANTREMVGATAIIMMDYPELILPDKLWKIQFKDNANVFYMKQVLSSTCIRKRFSAVSTGTSGSMYNVSMDKFKKIDIPLPPVNLQEKFAEFIIDIHKSRLLFKCQLLQYHSIEHIIRGRNYG